MRECPPTIVTYAGLEVDYADASAESGELRLDQAVAELNDWIVDIHAAKATGGHGTTAP